MVDVIIAGGGIVGMLCALELTERKQRVLLLDDQPRPSASVAAGGILSPLFPWRYSAAITRLCRDAVLRYQQLDEDIRAAGGVSAEVMATGMLAVTADAPGLVADWAAAHGEQVDCRGEVAPGQYQYWLPGVGSVRSPRLVAGLRTLLEVRGVTWLTAALEDYRCDGSGVSVMAAGQRLAARDLVLANGWRLQQWLPGAWQETVFPAKGEMLAYQLAPGDLAEIRLSETGYLIPRADGLVVAGSTLQPGVADVSPTVEAAASIGAMAAALMPALAGRRPDYHWAGVRPGTSRAAPLMGVLPDTQGRVWVCGGHFRNGIVMAPASARLLVKVMVGEADAAVLEDYSFSSPASSDSF